MFGLFPLMPAYGRDYKSMKDLMIDWNNNKDFITPSGQYTNKADLANMNNVPNEIPVRYNKMTKTGSVNKRDIGGAKAPTKAT